MSAFSSQPGRHLIDGTVRVFLAGLLFPLTGIITAAFLTRRLGPEGYGYLVLSATIVGWIELSLNSFFARTTIKFVAEAEDWQPIGVTISRLQFLVGLGAALVLVALAFPLARGLDEPVLARYLCLYSLHIPLMGLAAGYQNILIGTGKFKQKAVGSAWQWIARLILILLLVELGLSVEGAILGSIGAALVEIAISRRYVGLSLFGHAMLPGRPFWNVGVLLFLSGLSMNGFTSMGLVLLKAFGGTTQDAGIYGAAQNLSILPGIFSMSLAPLLFSTLSRLLTAGEAEQAKAMGQVILRMVLFVLPFAAMVAGAAHEIVTLFFGEAFAPAAPLFALLIWGGVAFVIISVCMTIVTSAGSPRLTFFLSAPLVVVSVLGYWAIVPTFGAVGAAMVTAFSSWLGTLICLFVVYRLWSIFPPVDTLARSVVAAGMAYVLSIYWQAPGFWVLIKLPVLSVAILLTYLILKELKAGEINQVLGILRPGAVEHPHQR